MRFIRIAFLAVVGVLALAFMAHASSHGSMQVKTRTGIPLPALLHDQVGPLNANFDAILSLSHRMLTYHERDWDTQARAEFLEVLDLTKDADAATWWGYAPGDVLNSDANPWHLPTHAKLRGAHELMTRLYANFGTEKRVVELFDKMNRDMFGLMGVCRYGDTTFNTAQPVKPDWSRVDMNVVYAQLGLGLAILLIGGTALTIGVRVLRKPLLRKAASV